MSSTKVKSLKSIIREKNNIDKTESEINKTIQNDDLVDDDFLTDASTITTSSAVNPK
jgi:hypothetical protein